MSTVDTKKLKEMVIPAEVQLTYDGHQFLRYDSRRSEPDLPWIVVWMSEYGHNLLRRTRLVGFDAQYTKAPRGFYQMFTVHAFIDDRFLVVGFAWMVKKDEETYDRVFRELFCYPEISYSLQAFVSGFVFNQ
uniref:MULE transposase domain-containing protein n=1 Tax=Ditylenchus dipsaci TaxID=166011 RepID=A0A915EME7_9BILA